MIFLELALQGIQGFAPLHRISLKPGINVGRSAEAYPRRAVLDAIYHSLYPDPARANATERLADRSAKDSRIALTFFGRDKETYRIVREAVTGAVSLHKFDKDTKKYTALTRTALEVGQYLRVNQQLPDEVGFERLFTLAPESMPSKGLRAKTRSGSGLASGTMDFPSAPGRPARNSSGIRVPPSMPSALSAAAASSSISSRSQSVAGFGSAMNPNNALVQAEMGSKETAPAAIELEEDDEPAEAADDLEQKREQLTKLREEMSMAARAERAQLEMDALNARKFELSGKAERARELRAEVEKLKSLSDSQSDLHNLPAGFGDRLRRFEEMQAKYQQDRGKLAEEREQIEAQLQNFRVLKLHEDRYFIASLLFGVMFITAAITFEKPGIALLNIPCVTIACAAAFRWVAELENKARTEVKLAALADRETRLERQYDLDTSALRRLMQKLEINDPRELLERIDGAEQLEKQLRAAEQALASFRADPHVMMAEKELEQVTKRLEALEAEVLGSQSITSSATLDRRVATLEREIAAIETKRGLPVSQPPVRVAQPRAHSSIATFPAPDFLRGGTNDLPRVITGDLVRAGSNIFKPYDPASQSNILSPLDPLKMDPVKMDPVRLDARVDPPTPLPPKPPARPLPPRPGSVVRPPNTEAASLFDFGGGNIGGDDDDGDEQGGYGSGYGSGGSGGRNPSGGGAGASSYSDAGEFYSDPPSGSGSGGEVLSASGIGGIGGGGGFGGGGYNSDDGTDGLGQAPDRSRDLMLAAVDILQISVDALGDKMEKRLRQYLEAFTDGKLGRVEFGPRGEISFFQKGESDAIAYPELAGAELDLVDSAIRFTLIEACLAKVRVPILIDDPFHAFPVKKRMLLSQMLGYLGKVTQIVLMTEKEDVSGNLITLSPE